MAEGIVGAYFAAWNRRDADAIVATFADGGTYTDPLAPGLTGAAIGAYAQGLWAAFPDLSFEIVGEPALAAGQVAAQWVMRGTNNGSFQGLPPTGRAITLHGADFLVVEDGKLRAVTGYFDAGEVPRQLGLQVLVQPDAIGPVRFGTSNVISGPAGQKPGAFGITTIHVRSEEEAERVRTFSRAVVQEMAQMPGFLGFAGVTIGGRMVTITAWDDAQTPRTAAMQGTHAEAMKAFFGDGLGLSGFTSVWVPDRINPMWVRCPACNRMADSETSGGVCSCGATLPDPPPYW